MANPPGNSIERRGSRAEGFSDSCTHAVHIRCWCSLLDNYTRWEVSFIQTEYASLAPLRRKHGPTELPLPPHSRKGMVETLQEASFCVCRRTWWLYMCLHVQSLQEIPISVPCDPGNNPSCRTCKEAGHHRALLSSTLLAQSSIALVASCRNLS